MEKAMDLGHQRISHFCEDGEDEADVDASDSEDLPLQKDLKISKSIK